MELIRECADLDEKIVSVRKDKNYGRTGWVKGSTVVEMSYLIPFCLFLFFLLITITFYFHDKTILSVAAAETAVTGVETDRKKMTEEVDLESFFRERIRGKLIFLSEVEVKVSRSGKRIEVEVHASKGRMKVHLIQRAVKTKPEEMIRWKT